tara:strand:- start:117 stop:509 length:393 start_codon:yes stop_codon:yes gene_type:complete
MPSIRKRIGYLPSINIQQIITNISKKEKLSQSKVVGILVKEALIARGLLDYQSTNIPINDVSLSNQSDLNNSSFKYFEHDELISDKGITYNRKRNKQESGGIPLENREAYNKDLFELFKQFMLFKNMLEK